MTLHSDAQCVQCLLGMQNILRRVRSELWLVVLCLLWRPWYSLQAALCAATSWTRPIGPWPSPPQASLKPHWAWARMEEIALGDWLAKSFNYLDFTKSEKPLVVDCVKQRWECFTFLTGSTLSLLEKKLYPKKSSEIWGFIWDWGIAAGFIILTENRD